MGTGCLNNIEDVTGTVQTEISFSADIQPIFNKNCTSCHGTNGGVDLRTYNALMNSVGFSYGNKVVVPRKPDESGLVDKIEPNPQFGARMPSETGLSGDEIQTIRAWILEGALNN